MTGRSSTAKQGGMAMMKDQQQQEMIAQSSRGRYDVVCLAGATDQNVSIEFPPVMGYNKYKR